MAVMKATLVTQLETLQKKLKDQESRIETGVVKLESEKGDRDLKRKEILLHKFKEILSSLRETDNKYVKEVKSEVFDHLRAVAKVEKDIARLLECVEAAIPQDLDTMEEAVNEVNQMVGDLQVEAFNRY